MKGVPAAVAALGLVVAVAGCSSSDAAKKDVTITVCNAGANGGHPIARGKIVNHSSKSSLYTVHVKFRDASGNSVGDGLAAVVKVDPGTAADWHATQSLDAKGAVKCTLSSVTRNAA